MQKAMTKNGKAILPSTNDLGGDRKV